MRWKAIEILGRLTRDKERETWPPPTPGEAKKAVYKDILEGFRELEEAKEYIEGMPEDSVIFTARGYEIPFSLIALIIEDIEHNPQLSPFTTEKKEPLKIKLTPKQIDIVHFRFLDIGHEWVKLKGSYLIIPLDRVKEALDILDTACDITRDWHDPAGRAEHRATCALYAKVKLASEPVVDNVEVYASSEIPPDIAQGTGLHRDPKVEYRYTTYYTGPDLNLFQRDLQRLLREQSGIPMLVVDTYYIRP